jgi:hypothetical protein
MTRGRWGRPSPALAISIAALAIACTGTAVAVSSKITSSHQIKKNVVNSGDIRDKTLQLSDTSEALQAALKGTPGPVAYAHVFSTGDVDEANSKGVADANVSHGSLPGYFCINLPVAVHSVVANTDLSFQDTGFAVVDLGAQAGGCPASTQVTVKTTTPIGGEFDDFFVEFN